MADSTATVTMAPERRNWVALVLGILAIILFLAVGWLTIAKNESRRSADEAKKMLELKQAEVIGLKAELENLQKALAEKPVPPPVPEGMILVSKDQVKIWEACCASEVARKQVAATKPKNKPKKALAKTVSATPAAKRIEIPPSVPPVTLTPPAPALPALVPPKGECFTLTLPQGNQ